MLPGERWVAMMCPERIGIFLIPFGMDELPTTALNCFDDTMPSPEHPFVKRVSIKLTSFRLIVSFPLEGVRSPIEIPLGFIENVTAAHSRETITVTAEDNAQPNFATVALRIRQATGNAASGDAANSRSTTSFAYVDVATKHVWAFRFAFIPLSREVIVVGSSGDQVDREAVTLARDLTELINGLRPQSVGTTYAFAAHSARRAEGTGTECTRGWGICDVHASLRRMLTGKVEAAESAESFLPELPFRVLSLQHAVFRTYPTEVIVPSRATLELLLSGQEFRQNARVPVVSWINRDSQGVLCRSSQPMITKKWNNDADERLLFLIQTAFADAKDRNARNGKEDRTLTTAVLEAQSVLLESEVDLKDAPTSWSLRANFAAEPHPLEKEDNDDEQTSPSDEDPVTPEPALFDRLQSISTTRTMHIFDCRSRSAATANMAKGGGSESVSDYHKCQLHFLNLENIHGVSSALTKMRDIFAQLHKVDKRLPLTGQARESLTALSSQFAPRIDATEWPKHVMKLIAASAQISEFLERGEHALVHCTDGWDRTPQVCTLTMILADGYYRSLEGFCELIEREWVQMGHRFADRHGHAIQGNSEKLEDAELDIEPDNQGASNSTVKPQRSCVFFQWIDCVYQLLCLFPSRFEFTPAMLLFLVDESYSCRFGTFLMNTHRARFRSGGVAAATFSVWDEVEARVTNERVRLNNGEFLPAEERFLNPFYNVSEPISRLSPVLAGRPYALWSNCFFRYDVFGHAKRSGLGLEFDSLSPLADQMLLLSLKHREHALVLRAANMWPSRNPTPQVTPKHWYEVCLDFGGSPQNGEGSTLTCFPRGQGGGSGQAENAGQCYLCERPFTLFQRRHTCRACCRSICAACSEFLVVPKAHVQLSWTKDKDKSKMRVCKICARKQGNL